MAAAPTPQEFFEMKVRPVLAKNCFSCHTNSKLGGLDLSTRESLLKGGKSGPAIVPGKPADSLLIKRITAQEMPPPKLQEQFSVRGLTDSELEKITTGSITSGAA